MKNLKLLLVIFLGNIVWNCANPDFGLEEENLISSELLGSDKRNKFDIDDLLLPHQGTRVRKLVTLISENAFGRKLLESIKRDEPYIRFDVNSTSGSNCMGYDGGGVIKTTEEALHVGLPDVLVFHELFHILQNGMGVIKSRNNEVEVYVACYLYYKQVYGSKSSLEPVFIHDKFTDIIKNLPIM